MSGKLKIEIAMMLVVSVIFCGCVANSPINPVGFLGGGKKKESTSYKENAKTFKRYIAFGTYQLLMAASNMEKAAGDAIKADLLRSQAEELLKNPEDADTISRGVGFVNETTVDRNDIAQMDIKEARKTVGESVVRLGAGVIADKKAVDAAQAIINNPPSGKDLLMGDGRKILSLSKTAVTTLPKHIATAGKWAGYLKEYMTDHKLDPIPADQQANIISSDIPPEADIPVEEFLEDGED